MHYGLFPVSQEQVTYLELAWKTTLLKNLALVILVQILVTLLGGFIGGEMGRETCLFHQKFHKNIELVY